ncbi:Methyltransferase gedG [Paramyrothecium foliicola]|nr:Methyltransferase gedG [Paramyrothecium foliicola]
MATQVVSSSSTSIPSKEHGFSAKQGANWSEYLAYRPIYPASFFQRIWEYHGDKENTKNSKAHDVGAGCGIVSSSLASVFNHVVVSDPNDGYVNLARKLLVEDSALSNSKFTFLQEGAEKSSVEAGTVDLITLCECVHWTDPVVAIRECHRELRPGGTLVITHYMRPFITGNDLAQDAWGKIWEAYAERATGPLLDRAFPILNTAFDHLEYPESDWTSVERVYINCHGNTNAFKMTNTLAKSNVKPHEKRIWVENDKDWTDSKGLSWYKAYLATWVPLVPESDIKHLWDDLEHALQGGNADMETPVVMVFATKM